MTEGVWTLFNCYLKAIGYFKVDTYVQRGVRGVIRNGYLYLTAYDDTGIYKINLSNSTDVTLISFGFTSEGKSQTGSGTCANYLFMANDLIIGWDYQIKPDDTVVQTVGSTRLLNLGTPLFQYKEFCFGWGGNYGSDYITGIMCAIADKKLSSEVGFKGICRKVLIFMLVGIANVLDVQVIGNGSILRTAVLFFYLSNEEISLLENAAHLGLPIPEKLKKVLEQLHERSEGDSDENKDGDE